MSASRWGVTPRQSIEAEAQRRGRIAVVDGCVALLSGREVDPDLLRSLGGPLAEHVLAGGAGGRHGYWPRCWAARGLLYVWDDRAVAAIRAALADEAWRVREMAAKVIARQLLGELLAAVAALRDDPVPRVRSAAERAVVRLTAAGV